MNEGKAVIFSAPSGSGKTTIVRHLLTKIPSLQFSISATTRSPRSNEKNGKDYYFLSSEEFKEAIKADALLEWEEVYKDTFYGTLKSEVERIWQADGHVIFDVDVKGGLSIKEKLKDRALAVFVRVSDISVLEERLKARGSESEESLNTRLKKARQEISFEDKFDLTIVNDDLDSVMLQAEKLVKDFIKEK